MKLVVLCSLYNFYIYAKLSTIQVFGDLSHQKTLHPLNIPERLAFKSADSAAPTHQPTASFTTPARTPSWPNLHQIPSHIWSSCPLSPPRVHASRSACSPPPSCPLRLS